MSYTQMAARTVASNSRRCTTASCRGLHSSSSRAKISNLLMPAMSPTMTEGGISSWKVKEGASFNSGEVLLEIETDKATIDVEAQDDGILGKILSNDGAKNVQVGKIIAILAEEGDDISNLEIPKDVETSSSSTGTVKTEPPSAPAQKSPLATPPKPSGSPTPAVQLDQTKKPIFPSVIRLLHANGVSADQVKGTGRRGMLTKGDVLAFVGKAKTPTGSYKIPDDSPFPKAEGKQPAKVPSLDAGTIRRLMVEGLSDLSKAGQRPITAPRATFDSIVADYLPRPKAPSALSNLPKPQTTAPPSKGYLDGLI